jgi:hypothetical protein
MAMQPGSLMRAWPRHMASYWAWRERSNVRVLLYPEMKDDLPGTVDRVAGLMGVELDAAQRAEVILRAGFAYMKSRESCFAPPGFSLLTGDSRGQMLRSGKSGNSGEGLSFEQGAEIDAIMIEELCALESEFPYRELFMTP